jgi:hypothetical protein
LFGQNREEMMGKKVVGETEKKVITGGHYRTSKSSSPKSPTAAALSPFFPLNPKP